MVRYARAMARIQTLVQLTDDLLAALDEEAAARGISRSALLREIVEGHLETRRADHVSRSIVDGYRELPPATPDGWGDLDAVADRSRHELEDRLAAEERAQGFEPW
jgi:hypothetical protein